MNEQRGLRDVLGPMLFIQGVSATVEVILRGRFGSRYLGFQLAFGMLFMAFYLSAVKLDDAMPMMLLWFVVLCLTLIEKTAAIHRSFRPDAPHTMYSGKPRGLKRNPKVPEIQIKKWFEPFAVCCVAFITSYHNVLLADYLYLASGCLFITVRHAEIWAHRRAIAVNDAVLDQRDLAERFRKLQGDGDLVG